MSRPCSETTFVSVWVREKGTFYRALKSSSYGERLRPELPEAKGADSFARWEDGGRAKGAKVADTGTVTKVGKRQLTIRSGGAELILVHEAKAPFPPVTEGSRVVFRGAFELYQPPRKRNKRGRPKGKPRPAFVRGTGTIRVLK